MLSLLSHQLDQYHLGAITLPRSQFENAGVAALAILKPRGNIIKQLLDNISAGIPQVCCSAPSRIDLIDFAAI